MHIEMYVPENPPRAKLKIYRKIKDGWDEDVWFADTLEDVAREAGMDLGEMNEAYEQLAALGVEVVGLTSYTASGNDTNDPEKAKLWAARFRHPQNSGMSSSAKGESAGAALRDAVAMESKRQRDGLLSSLAYHEREAARLREHLEAQ